jgi:hypothetical protein
MKRDIPRASKLRRRAAALRRLSLGRLAMICVVAFFATGVWWAILHFGSQVVGYPIGTAALICVLAGIYLLLVLGLSMAAMATNRVPGTPLGRRENVAVSAQTRRKVG